MDPAPASQTLGEGIPKDRVGPFRFERTKIRHPASGIGNAADREILFSHCRYSGTDESPRGIDEMPSRAKHSCLMTRAHKIAPSAVPNVFVRRSVIPESRVGRNDCS